MAATDLTASVRLLAHPRLPNTRFTTTRLAWCQVVKGTCRHRL